MGSGTPRPASPPLMLRGWGGSPRYPPPASLRHDFPPNSRLKPRSPRLCQTGVLYETSPPCGDPPPPRFISRGRGGSISSGPMGGLTSDPPAATGRAALRVEFQTEWPVPVISEKRGGGVRTRPPPTYSRMRPPHPWHTPPCPILKIFRWGVTDGRTFRSVLGGPLSIAPKISGPPMIGMFFDVGRPDPVLEVAKKGVENWGTGQCSIPWLRVNQGVI